MNLLEELPRSWIEVNLGEYVLNTNGARRPVSKKERENLQGDYPYYGATGQIDSLNDFTHEGEHVLIGEDGANLLSKSKDLAFLVDGQFWVNNHAHAIKCLADAPNKYIACYINSLNMAQWVTGSAQPKLTKGNLESIPVPVASLAEQQQIAARLDTLLAQVDILKARLDAIPTILKRFRQSVLAVAVSGQLTEQWRRGAALTGWLTVNIGSISSVSTGKTPKRSDNRYWDHGTIPWLTSAATGQDFCSTASQYVTAFAVDDCSLKVYEPGTLLLAMYGEGKTRGQVTELQLRATCNQACAALRVDEGKALRAFVKLRLQENYEETRKAAAGGAQPNLNLNKVRAIPIHLPPLEEQTEIVRRVEQLFTFADQIEQRVKDVQARVNHLTQSILAKAFRGELTAEWREQNPELISGENSAEALLARIQAEQAAAKPAKRGRRKAG